MTGAFTDALDQLDVLIAAEPFDPWTVRGGFYDVSKAIVPGIPAEPLRRMVAHCFWMLGLGQTPPPDIVAADQKRSLLWSVDACLHALFIDQRVGSRPFVQSGMNRRWALGPDLWSGGPEELVPLPNIPLDPDEATALIAPYLDHLEAQIDDDPMAHITLVWKVLEAPVPPFETVFERWLAQVDARRGTDDLMSIRRAMALKTLAYEGQQRLSWENCERYLLPQLCDPSALVAAAAGKFLGALYSWPEDQMINGGTPMALTDLLGWLALLPRHRRAVAGGFVYGLCEGSLAEMRARPDLVGFDLDRWVMNILSERVQGPYLPSAQSFWFHVHEGYCFDPVFIGRMIDAGHLWEAMMTATEMHIAVDGMKPVLERLAALDEYGIAAGARRWLDLHYSGAQV